ncbi:MAG: ribonuclease H-like domain-containing protein [Burkholderiales bacterium]|nr:ribonuclease H-like domain-containing protein [Burkholderiales bacterium]
MPGLLAVERRYALPHVHGAVPITFGGAREVPVPIRRGDTRAFDPERLLMLDTETTGLAGGTGTMAFLVGLAGFEPGCLVVRQYVATAFSAETAMLAAVRAWVARADCLLTFNGKSFDVPLLKARFALAREPHPFEAIAHADLLHATRRRLREDWPDCRLRTTEERALGFARIDDLPGAEVPLAWQRWLRQRDPAPIPRILDHNREDLVSLAALLALLARPTAKEAPLLAPIAGC